MLFSTSRGRPTGGAGGRQALLFFTSEEDFDFGFGFDLRGWVRPPMPDQREGRVARDHAVYLGWKLWKSLRLARCISRAASVSDWVWAWRSSSASVTYGRR